MTKNSPIPKATEAPIRRPDLTSGPKPPKAPPAKITDPYAPVTMTDDQHGSPQRGFPAGG
jgi:hypothetical protein